MTLGEAIQKAAEYRPNNKATESDIIRWVGEVDSRIKTDIYDAYFVPKMYEKYNMDTPMTTPLLADDGFDKMYQYYICASIDMLQGDSERYNQQIQSFPSKNKTKNKSNI